ncbi:MAG: fibronectin type III domain-containing protein [Vicinamibacterales bacterium]
MPSRPAGLVLAFVLAFAAPAAAQLIPFPPTGTSAQITGSTVSMTWNAAPRATTYVIEVGSAHGRADIGSIATTSAATSFTAAGVPVGIYYVRVRGVNGAGTGQAGNEVTVAVGPPCQLPTVSGLSVSVAGTVATLSWTGANATSYRLEAGPTPGSAFYYDLDLGAATSLSANVPPGTFYVRVRGQNACGLGLPSSEAIVAVNVPSVVQDLRASVIGSAVTLRWAAPSSNDASNYVLGLGSAPWSFDLGYASVGTTTSYTAGGVPAGTYYVKAQAVGAGGLGPHSNELAITVGPPPAGTAVVTFNALAPNGPAFVSHTESGFSVEAVSGPWVSGPALISRNTTNLTPLDSELKVTAVGGGAFRLASARLYSSVTTIPYVFRGVRNGVTVYTATGTVPNTFGNYATVPNPYADVAVDAVFLTVTNPASPQCPSCGTNPVGVDDIVLWP